MSVRKIECLSFNSTVAQNTENLFDMFKRKSLSAVLNVIKLYTEHHQNMQNQYAKYILICTNVAQYVKIYKNAKNTMQIFKVI